AGGGRLRGPARRRRRAAGAAAGGGRHQRHPARRGQRGRAGAAPGGRAAHAGGRVPAGGGRARMSASVSAGDGKLHDLGYRKYTGPRRAGGELWKVVARRGLRTSLRNWMVIIVFVITFIIFCFMAAFLYVMTKAGAAFSKDLGADPSQMMLQIARADQFLGELVALIIGSSVLTDDFRTGAFAFYFSRPITRGAYLLGKLVPVAFVVGLVALAPTVLLRLEVFAIKGEARELIPVTRAITQGLVATVALCAP